jgi:peptide/nickel transport system substrate-binding protein
MKLNYKNVFNAVIAATALSAGSVVASTLDVAYDSQPGTLDVQRSTNLFTREVSRTFYETLVTLNGDYQPVPHLAEAIEVNDARTEYTFHLRKGVKFHNGKEMKSADVLASMERWVGVNSRAKRYFAEASFAATDDYTIVLTMNAAKVDVLHVLASWNTAVIMPKEVVEGADDKGVKEFIGTGPFKFDEWKQDQYIHIVKYEDYQALNTATSGFSGGKEANVDDIYFHFVSDTATRGAGMQSGQYDIAMRMSTDDFDRFNTDPNIGIAKSYLGYLQMNYNNKEGILSNVDMRHAVNAAINPEEILLGAYSSPEFFALNSCYNLPEQKDWFTDTGEEFYNQNDAGKAKSLMSQAGYNGEEITLITVTDPSLEAAAIIIEAQLEAIGINTKVEVYDFATYAQKRNDPANWQIAVQPFSLNPIPTQWIFFNPGAFGWTDDEELLGMVKQMQNGSVDEAKALWPQVHKRSWEYLPISKIGDTYGYSVFNSEKVKGFSTFDQGIFWNVSVSD